MNQSFISSILTKIGLAILAIVLVDLLYLNYWVFKNTTSNQVENEERSIESNLKASDSPQLSPSPSPAAADMTSPTTPSPVVRTETIVQKETQTIVQTAQKEIFIPIGSGTTLNGSYVDLAGLEVGIDTTKYSAIESVVFEASIWVQDGNGKMYTQLYNVTDKHPVWDSEISTSSATGVLTTSQKIAFGTGQRTYRVQARTNLTAYTAHVDNARIKITLK